MRTPLPTVAPTAASTAVLSAALVCAALLTGCDSIHRVYKRDTGTIEPVAAPRPVVLAVDYPDQEGGTEAHVDEVMFTDTDTDTAPQVLAGEGPDAILPLDEAQVLPEVVETYVVEKGDTLGHISQKLFGTVGRTKDLMDANPGINPTRMQIGDVINVPR